jgi:hypothetical protein
MNDNHDQPMKLVKVTTVKMVRVVLEYDVSIPAEWPMDASLLDCDQRDYVLEDIIYSHGKTVEEYVNEETIVKMEESNE